MDFNVLMLFVPFGAREAGCFREVAAVHSGHLRQVPLYATIMYTSKWGFLLQGPKMVMRICEPALRTLQSICTYMLHTMYNSGD